VGKANDILNVCSENKKGITCTETGRGEENQDLWGVNREQYWGRKYPGGKKNYDHQQNVAGGKKPVSDSEKFLLKK